MAAVKSLKLPPGSYIVFGSGPLAAYGLREAGDVDLYVSEGVLEGFKAAGWQQIEKGPDDKPYSHGIFEAHAHWNFSPYAPTLKQLLKTATVIEGVPFASLDEVRKWKAASDGLKHAADVRLIDDYLSKA